MSARDQVTFNSAQLVRASLSPLPFSTAFIFQAFTTIAVGQPVIRYASDAASVEPPNGSRPADQLSHIAGADVVLFQERKSAVHGQAFGLRQTPYELETRTLEMRTE